MRTELRKISEEDYRVYGLSEGEFAQAIGLSRLLARGQKELYRQHAEKVRREQPELADDILDDIAYSTYLDTQSIWHFALWRLQAVFEGLIVHTFLKRPRGDGLSGLRKKLEAMVEAGFPLAESDRDDLLAWGRVRNALSHAPPEWTQSSILTEEDVVEYRDLVVRICRDWRKGDG